MLRFELLPRLCDCRFEKYLEFSIRNILSSHFFVEPKTEHFNPAVLFTFAIVKWVTGNDTISLEAVKSRSTF